MPAATITQALLARFASNGPNDFVGSGGLWFDEIPENETLPFAGFFHNGETLEYVSETYYTATGSHEFHIFAVGIAATEELAKSVMDCFDGCIVRPVTMLPLVNQSMVAFSRRDYRIGQAIYKDKAGNLVGEATFTYDYTVRRSLP